MKINYGISGKLKSKSIITIGNFDGVHKGHQSLLKFCAEFAQKNRMISTVITFKPHPKVFFQNKPIGCIQTLRDKVIEIKNAKVKHLIILPFKKELANVSANNFVKFLVINLGMRAIVVGKDFKFGKNREGNIKTLVEMGAQLKFQTHIINDVAHSNEKISSSKIRNLARLDRLERVKEFRGKSITLSGHVLHGKKIGRTLGYPTINIKVPDDLCINGIFAATVSGLQNHKNQVYLPAIASLGRRPTVENYGKLILEVYILDWDSMVYGKIVSVQIHEKIREEIKFESFDKLRRQMKMDEIKTRKIFKFNEKQ